MPIGVAIKEGADVIITMGFESPYQTRISSVMRFAFQLSSITSNNLLKANYAFHNLAHHHEILPIIPQFEHKIHLFDTDKIPLRHRGGRARDREADPLSPPAPRAPERVTAPPGRLLVVDDTEVNRDLLARRLRALGHEVAMAVNGREALEVLGAREIDLVLLDIMMPEMDGFQVLERMRQDAALRTIPVIMISAVDEIDSVARAIELGAADYLPKPFNAVVLRARVTATLEKKRLEDADRLHTRALERDLEIGRQIQRDFLPDALPQPAGWEIAAAFHPARQVAGDFYDAFALEDGRVALVVGRRLRQGRRGRALHGPLPQPPAFPRRASRRGHAGRARGAQHRGPDQRLHRPNARPLEHVRDDLLRDPRSGVGRARVGQRRARAARPSPGRRDDRAPLPRRAPPSAHSREWSSPRAPPSSLPATCSSRSPTERPKPDPRRVRSTGRTA